MDVAALRPLMSGTVLSDVEVCRAELVAIGVARGLLDAREVEVVGRLDELAAADPALFPQDVVAKAAKASLLHAERLRERADACRAIPELGSALADGATTGDRVDIVVRASAGLSAAERAALAGYGRRLALAASEQTAAGFRKTVEHVIRQVRADDGLARLERQRRQARLRWWLDADGMWNLAGRVDPATGARMEGLLRNRIDRIRAGGLPDTCPTEPVDAQQHLAALALAELLGVRDTGADIDTETANPETAKPAAGNDGRAGPASGPTTPTGDPRGSAGSGGGGVPDVTVIIDERTLREGRAREGTVCDVGLGKFGLPIETIRRWACIGTVTPVVVAADGTRLLLGRETRLANAAQRRALRVFYRSCALCETPFDHCQVHHVGWFALGGFTDIDNLLPLCSRHHHLVHEGGWVLHLAPDRALTVTRPGDNISTHPPPNAWAA